LMKRTNDLMQSIRHKREKKNMSAANAEEKILDSIKYVKEKLGWTIVAEDWGTHKHKCADAMGAVLLKNNPKLAETYDDDLSNVNYIAVAKILNTSERWVDSFIEGFDGKSFNKEAMLVKPAWELGEKIRKAVKPIDYWEFLHSKINIVEEK
jgi:hypothetical protein